MFGVNGLEFHTQRLMEQLERDLKSDKSVSNQCADERRETKSRDLDVMIPMQEVRRHDSHLEDTRNRA